MKFNKKISMVVFFCLGVFAIVMVQGCAILSPSKVMDSWVGHHQSELIASWGPPTRTADDGKGGTILIYEYYRDLGQKEGRAYVDYRGNIRYTDPKQRGYTAVRMFYVDENGIIYYWRRQGL